MNNCEENVISANNFLNGSMDEIKKYHLSQNVILALLPEDVEVYMWRNHEENLDYSIFHDDDKLHFALQLTGTGATGMTCRDGFMRYERFQIKGVNYVSYRPGTVIDYKTRGEVMGLTLSLPSKKAIEWMGEESSALSKKLASGHYFLENQNDIEINKGANWILETLSGLSVEKNNSIILLGKALTLAGYILEVPTLGMRETRAQLSGCDQRLLYARDMILSDLGQPPRLEQIAKCVGMSVSSLQRGFRRLFGKSPYMIFHEERMQAAYRRLRQDEASIVMIASDIGYSNPSHFSSAFRKMFGLSPSLLRSGRTRYRR
ncbi:helix-turn-helix transcriptional regulator [Komagataeibacter rhaeticus]|nr:AraC family transcriptional regulator [Komagataeibacter xylinus]GBQ70959.1 helix-turn-helix domain-containing protein [Komagataeibacter xylinus NBRC 15237]